MSLQSVETYLIAQTSLRIVVDITFLVFYIIRINKLDKMASNNYHIKPKSMKIKILLLLILEILFVLHILLAFFDTSYWMHPYQYYSLVWAAQIVNCLLQIYIVRKQHKKKAIKALSVPLLWIFWLIFNMATIIFTQIVIPNTSILVLIFSAMIFVALIIIGYFFQSKDSNKDQILQTIDYPLINENRSVNQRIYQNSEDNEMNKLYVQFNKQFNITAKQSKLFCEFKFAVYFGHQSTILMKSEQQFLNLASDMIKAFPECSQIKLKDKNRQTLSNMKKYGQQMQKYYESYLIELTKNQKFYITPLLDFLQISASNRLKLLKKRQKNIYSKKDSFPNQSQQQRFQKPFFKVQIISNKIHICNPDILEIIVNKSKLQIQKFHNKLISQKKLKMQLLTEQPDINQISHFLYRIVNSKILWKSFSQWMVLGKQLQQKIYHMFDFWDYGFKNIKIHIIGYEIAFDKQGSIHNLYLLNLSPKKNNNQSQHFLKQDVTLKKRYNDFVKLDRGIRKYIHTNNIKNSLSFSLPPKFSPFGTKTSPKSRQIYLDTYINEILKIQNINQCVNFLQFLQVDLGRFKQQFYTVNQQDLANQHISSFIIDELENKY